MEWLFEGIIVNIIWLILVAVTKIIISFIKCRITNLTFNEHKVRFHLLLLILILYTANIFLKFQLFFTYGYSYLTTTIIAFLYLYFSVVKEYNDLFNQVFKK